MTFIEELDDRIANATPEEQVALFSILAARLAALSSRMLEAPLKRPDAEPTSSRNLSPKEAARKLGVSLPYLYKHADEFPFTRRFGTRKVVFDSAGLEAWNLRQVARQVRS